MEHTHTGVSLKWHKRKVLPPGNHKFQFWWCHPWLWAQEIKTGLTVWMDGMAHFHWHWRFSLTFSLTLEESSRQTLVDTQGTRANPQWRALNCYVTQLMWNWRNGSCSIAVEMWKYVFQVYDYNQSCLFTTPHYITFEYYVWHMQQKLFKNTFLQFLL